jgi:hypothetical protein
MDGYGIIMSVLRGLAWLAENFPDDPRIAKRLLLIAALLIAAFFLSYNPPGYEDLILILRYLALISGAVCATLGSYVFFRRAVWWRQDKAGSGLVSLDLTPKGNNSCRSSVFPDDKPEVFLSDEPFD